MSMEFRSADGPSTPASAAWNRFVANRPACVGAVLLLSLLLAALFGPIVLGDRGQALTLNPYSPPSWQSPFGTDLHGRDILSRVIAGARVSLLAGFAGALVSLVIGVAVGAVSGYLGGRIDEILMRIVDALYALPSIIFVIVLVTLVEESARSALGSAVAARYGDGLRMLLLLAGLGAVSWLTMARIVRGEVLSLKTRPFVEASRCMGASHFHIIRHHLLPNIAGVVIAYLMLTIPSVILYESFLSYLGLGIKPPQASLGTLIAEGAGQLNPVRICWWLLVFPAGTLAGALVALNLVGEGLRDALDPQSGRNSRSIS